MSKRVVGALAAIILGLRLIIVSYAAETLVVDLSGVLQNDTTSGTALQGIVGTDYADDGALYKSYFKLENNALFIHEDFEFLDYEDKSRTVTELVEYIQESTQISGMVKQAIYNSLSDKLGDAYIAYIPEIVDATTADLLGGLAFLAPFRSGFGTFLGILVILIVVLLLTSTIMDIAYLISPSIMNWFLDENESRPRIRKLFISREARACAEANISGNLHGNVYLKYFGKRWVTYVILSVCILYLLTGQIANLIGGILDATDRVV